MAETLSLDPTISFWKSEYYKWICFTPSLNGGVDFVDLFRLNLDSLFRLKRYKIASGILLSQKVETFYECWEIIEHFFGKGLLLLPVQFLPRFSNRYQLPGRCASLLLHLPWFYPIFSSRIRYG